MVRGIADLAFVPVPERIGVIRIFPVDAGDRTHMTIDPGDITAARMTRIDILFKQLLVRSISALLLIFI